MHVEAIRPAPPFVPLGGPLLVVIIGRTQVGSLRRWLYDWYEAVMAPDGTLSAGPRAGTAAMNTHIVNVCELLNVVDHGGTQGNGVNESRSGFPVGFHLQPLGGEVGVNTCALAWQIPEVDSTGHVTPRWAVCVPNAEDGGCS